MNKNNFNGFESEEQYLSIFDTLKEIQENNDTYDRDTLMVYKEEDCIEFFIDDYIIQIWDEDVEVYVNRENMRLVDNGIMNVCFAILEMLRDGKLKMMFN